MTAAFSASSKVILELEYDPEQPAPAIQKVSEWAETKIKELEQKFTDLILGEGAANPSLSRRADGIKIRRSGLPFSDLRNGIDSERRAKSD